MEGDEGWDGRKETGSNPEVGLHSQTHLFIPQAQAPCLAGDTAMNKVPPPVPALAELMSSLILELSMREGEACVGTGELLPGPSGPPGICAQ